MNKSEGSRLTPLQRLTDDLRHAVMTMDDARAPYTMTMRREQWMLIYDTLQTVARSEIASSEKPRRWADQYDFDKSDPHTRLFVAASNWMDRAERAEEELKRVKVERGEMALKLAGAECFIEEQRKKGNIK